MLRDSNLLRAVGAALLIGTWLSAGGAFGQDASNDAKLRADDRAVVAACLKIAADAAKGGAGAATADAPTGEKIDARAWMAAKAAHPDKPDAASCIGVVSTPCLAVPSNGSTVAMADCLRRETAIWDERLNAAYKSWTSKCDSPDICEARRKLERAWLAYRDARCTLPHVEAQGGTIAIIEDADCLLDATARQAIWIEQHIGGDAN
ncbi:MAG: DUF1311 domain-containing protein [Xanthobacteraceae bacterium]|nr:DUF1311 domain-containing protein [Xanthobacteraceae bacterium]